MLTLAETIVMSLFLWRIIRIRAQCASVYDFPVCLRQSIKSWRSFERTTSS